VCERERERERGREGRKGFSLDSGLACKPAVRPAGSLTCFDFTLLG